MLSFFSCSKIEQNGKPTEYSKKITASSSRTGEPFDTLDFLMNGDNPTRAVRESLKHGGTLPATKSVKIADRTPTKDELQQMAAIGNPTYPNYHCCNDICLTIPEDPYGFYAPFLDKWGNAISYIGHYGADPRQIYYVYLPNNVTANAKIVVFIHGGGWTTGPDPNKINGFNSGYCNEGTENSNNIVKNLLASGYVVVAPLYRLVAMADKDADDLLTPVTVLDQVDDIDAAITHMHNNFPTCLWQHPLNANNIQVLGESAGANLTLLFAYTKANTSYIKSVVSVAGPTNLNTAAVWLKDKQKTLPCLPTQSALNDFYWGDVVAYPTKVHFPKYTIFDEAALNAPTNTNVTNITNQQNFNCKVASIFYYGIPFGAPAGTSPSTSLMTWYTSNTNKRINDAYHLAQYCTRSIVTNPATNSNLQLISPSYVLNSSRIVPTFIIHGNNDWIVPYSTCTANMSTKLAANGGLIGTYNSTTNNIPPNINYTTQPSKHIIKIYSSDGIGALFGHAWHDVANHTQTQGDVVKWFNQH